MKNFGITILASSLVGGIINSLVSKNSKLKKYVLFVVTLVCTLTLISPISSILGDASKLRSSVENFFKGTYTQDKIDAANDLIISTSKQRIEKGIKDLIIQRYKFDSNEVDVDIILNEDEIDSINIEKIHVNISGKAAWSDLENIKRYLEDILSGEITINRR